MIYDDRSDRLLRPEQIARTDEYSYYNRFFPVVVGDSKLTSRIRPHFVHKCNLGHLFQL